MATKPSDIIREAGKRAATWCFDTGDCLFCNRDNADGAHEDHCAFHGCTDGDLRAFVAEGEPHK